MGGGVNICLIYNKTNKVVNKKNKVSEEKNNDTQSY